jgi:hypothetical protein
MNILPNFFIQIYENINDDIHKQTVKDRVNSYINECLFNYHEK